MAASGKKVKRALDEARMLVLGAQILLGFQFRAFLEPGFARLPALSQDLRLFSLFLTLAAILLLMSPATYHEIAYRGKLTQALHQFATAAIKIALLPFALSLGIDIYTVAGKLGNIAGLASGIAVIAMCLLFWYGWEYLQKGRVMREHQKSESATPLDERVETLLTECRVVIPGSQALLGFQLVAMLMDRFDAMSSSLKYIHLASTLIIALSVILLMAPAAFHRIVERGDNSERFVLLGRKLLLAGMAVLAAGLSSELFVVMRLVVASSLWSIITCILCFTTFCAIWFIYPSSVRSAGSVHL